MRAALLLVVAALPGCFWGATDARLFFQVSGSNYGQYEDLLYPADRAEAWAGILDGRTSVCVDGDEDDGCAGGTWERSDLLDLYLPYETERARGLITQKGDLQITAHVDVGGAWGKLGQDDFEDLAYLDDVDRVYGWSGDGCGAEHDAPDRSGAGRCLREEMRANGAAYGKLSEDLRLVIVVNLPGEDDLRSTYCQDRPDSFASDDWIYPRTLRVNYNATVPVGEEGEQTYGDPEVDPPLPQCDIEVFATLRLGLETFGADWYGQGAEPGLYTLDRTNEPCVESADGDCPDPLLGTVEIEELTLPVEREGLARPGAVGAGHAAGRFRIAFTSDRFAARDGTLEALGRFDVEVRTDPEEIDEPERQLDIEGVEG